MSLLNRLLEQLEKRGLSVKPGAEPGQLFLAGPAAEKTPEIMAAVKAFKPQLLEKFGRKEPVKPPETPYVPTVEVVNVPGAVKAMAEAATGPTVCQACGVNWWIPVADIRETVNRGPHYCQVFRCPFRKI